ncbi:MAG: M28 family metallopeptidase [Acidobacteria bacterium]|nr:M28 family metallopeptidase [Acidobacteriota bacterium]
MSIRCFHLFAIVLLLGAGGAQNLRKPGPLTGFLHSQQELAAESRFAAIPDPKLAEEHLRILTAAPHIAGSPEDKVTADYVAGKFQAAGLKTEFAEYRVWMNYPQEISVDMTAPADVHLHAPSREHVDGDPYQEDPRVVTPFNAMSPSGDAEAPVVYANYGNAADFETLTKMNISVRGKIVIARYGQNYRGTKAQLAEEHGAAGLILYSDPADDGRQRGAPYPQGPWRPDTGIQRGSISLIARFPGDVTTPGFASLPTIADSKRIRPEDSPALPRIPTTPISAADATPILQHLSGPEVPKEWKGGLPFTYRVGPGPATVKLHLKQDYQFRTIWDVIGTVRGSTWPDALVIAGNHRDAWVYGAVDPGSGTAAMLEAVHGIGELLRSGWRPKRTLVFCSWDGEEQGLLGSTEWGEAHPELEQTAVAYFNTDMAVSGPKFGAAAVPSLKQFVRDITKAVADPQGGTVYDRWMALNSSGALRVDSRETSTSTYRAPLAGNHDVPVSDLGSGSDYAVFLQHLGIASTDVGSSGDYGVYHSAFDNFLWFQKFADPDFRQEQKMARVFGFEAIRMADIDVLPYDFKEYGEEIEQYIVSARERAKAVFPGASLDFEPALEAARRLAAAGKMISVYQNHPPANVSAVNTILLSANRALLLKAGIPGRPWFRHAIYAPGRRAGYAAVAIPGVNDSLEAADIEGTRAQLTALIDVLDDASRKLMRSGTRSSLAK